MHLTVRRDSLNSQQLALRYPLGSGFCLLIVVLLRPTQSSIPPGSVNREPASAGKAKTAIAHSIGEYTRGWQVNLCDP